jgi:hypothetical protein
LAQNHISLSIKRGINPRYRKLSTFWVDSSSKISLTEYAEATNSLLIEAPVEEETPDNMHFVILLQLNDTQGNPANHQIVDPPSEEDPPNVQVSIVQKNESLQRKCVEFVERGRDQSALRSKSQLLTDLDVILDSDIMNEKVAAYYQTLHSIKDKLIVLDNQRVDFDKSVLELQYRLQERQSKSSRLQDIFDKMKRNCFGPSNNPQANKKHSQMQETEQQDQTKHEIMKKLRIKHLLLKAKLDRIEDAIRLKEQLAEGFF